MIHPLAQIHPDAIIGDNVEIGPFVTIENNVEIGEGTWIGPNATIMYGARIGSHCKVFPGAVISAIPQDLKFAGEKTIARIGNNVTIRECVTVNRGTKASNETVVGDNTLLMAYVHVAHDCIIGRNCILANSTNLAGHIVVDDYAIVGGMSAVHQFVRIGTHTMIAGGSLVRKDVPPYTKAAREPLSYNGVNSIGLRRRGFTSEQIDEIKGIYRILYQSNLSVRNALSEIENHFPPTPERETILSFVRSSRRGLMKGYRNNDLEENGDTE